jgi:hypothetical protein
MKVPLLWPQDPTTRNILSTTTLCRIYCNFNLFFKDVFVVAFLNLPIFFMDYIAKEKYLVCIVDR